MAEDPRRRVLVVDDDEMIRALLEAGLAAAGYRVAVASTGAQALDLLGASVPDVIVSDVTMPDMDGFALVQALRVRPELRRIPLIFLSSRAELDDVVEGLRLGADDYLAKPFALPELVARVEAKALRVPVPVEDLHAPPAVQLLSTAALTGALTRERERAAWSARSGALAVLAVDGLEELRDLLGRRGVDRVRVALEDALRAALLEGESAGLLSEGRFALVLPHLEDDAVAGRLREVEAALGAAAAQAADEEEAVLRVVSGWASLTAGADAQDVLARAGAAGDEAKADPARSPVRSALPAAAPAPAGDDLQRAAEVQRSLLPQRPPVLAGYDVAGLCLPTAEVGGDFFDWHLTGPVLALTLADAMGKGMGAAIVTATVRAVLRAGSSQADLSEAVGQAAATLESDLEQTSTFVTLFHGRLHPETGRLEYVDAGHGLTYLVRPDASAHRLAVRGLPVGALPGSVWQVGEAQLEPGDCLLVVSDGVLDLYGDEAESTGLELGALVAATSTAQEVVDGIVRRARESGLQADDVTAVVVRRRSA